MCTLVFGGAIIALVLALSVLALFGLWRFE